MLPFETVDADDGVRARQFLQLPLQFCRIVGERVELRLRHFVAELGRAAIRCDVLEVAADGDGLFEPGQRQHHHELLLAGTNADVAKQPQVEARELGTDAVTTEDHALEYSDAVIGGGRGRRRLGLGWRLEPHQRHRRAGDDTAGLINDGDLDAAVAGGLRLRRDRAQAHE